MTALSVREDLDVVKYGVGEIQSGAPFLPVQKFYLHARPEEFHHGVDAPMSVKS